MNQRIRILCISVTVFVAISLFLPYRTVQAATFSAGSAAELIAAINAANANAEADIITLTADITLDTVADLTAGANGLPPITTEIIINGNGHVIQRNPVAVDEFRIFYLPTGSSNLTLRNVTVSGGSVSGGAPGGRGGGIYNYLGTVTVINSTLSSNSATWGGGILNYGGTVNVENSTVQGNSVTGQGGGIYNFASASLNLSNSIVFSNIAPTSAGGGIYNSGTAEVASSTLSGNSATDGGAAYNSGGSLSVINSTLSDNVLCVRGCGIQNALGGVVTVVNSILSGNSATYGGAIFIWTGTVEVTNSTLSGNSATDGGGIYNFSTSTVTITHVTLSDNTASGTGGGIHNNGTPAQVNINGSIVANSTGGDCTNNLGTYAGANNLSDSGTCQGTAAISPTINLDSLADNGGPTLTHALLVGSSAIDGTGAACGAAPVNGVDQRYYTRDGDCDVGAYEYVGSAISGFVWVDTNGNGVQDSPPESGVDGVTVTLLNSDLTPTGLSTTTQSGGYYSFANVAAGDYVVEFVSPAGMAFTEQDAGADDVDSDPDPTTGQTTTITLSAPPPPDNENTWDAGVYFPVTLSGFVYDDADNDGVFDAGESGIENVTITLGGTASSSITTNSSGYYEFTDLAPGTYTITETQPVAYIDGIDTLGTLGGTLGADTFTNIVVSSGDGAGTDYNFGEQLGGSLSGFVYVDADDDGIFDPGETPIENVTLTLSGTASGSTITNSSGYYEFVGLEAGTYTITETQPAGYVDGQENPAGGSLGGTVGNDVYSAITVARGDVGVDYNFGESQSGSLSGYVYVDLNNDGNRAGIGEVGIENVTIDLLNSSGAVVDTTTTDNMGYYEFVDLAPDTYSIVETQPPGYIDGIDTRGTLGGDDLSVNDVISDIVLPVGGVGTNYNFGERLLPAPTTGEGPRLDIFDPAISKVGALDGEQLGLPGEQVTWTIIVTNVGGVDGTNVVVTDTLPADLRIDSVTTDKGTFTINGQTVTFAIGTLAPGETVTMQIVTTVLGSPADGLIANTATVTDDSGITRTATGTVTVVSGLPSTGYPPNK